MRARMPSMAIALTLLLSGCGPEVAFSFGRTLLLTNAVHASARGRQIEETPAEAEARDQKRQLENAAARATSDRLEWEREAAAKARGKSSDAGDVISDPGPADPGLPERLDPALIREAIGAVTPRVMSCSTRSAVKGQVWVSLKVAPDGHVLVVEINSTPDAALGSCVVTAVHEAAFAKTQHGGAFRYPFVFRHEETRSAE